jgi:predicted lipid-binding transport protein (Tim44 family)
MFRYRWVIAFAAVATALVLVAGDVGDANARAGGGSSGGSRGSRTFSAPAPTRTAPTAAAPLNRTMTQPGAASTAATGSAARPGLLGGGLFGGGLLGGLAAGFIGAGLFGMLFGHGMFGGMGGFASILGLILQIGLVIIVARLAYSWWQRRNQPAEAYASPNAANNAAHPATGNSSFSGLGGMFGGGQGANVPAEQPLTIAKEDYDAFESILEDVQAAYSAEDLNALRAKATPEMVSYFAEEMTDNASRGVINRVTDVKLLQGDLAEAWNENNADYATVAMRFGLTDSTVDRASGRVVEGGSPSEVTELWTFRRAPGGNWLLSAIQQA